MSPIPSPAPIPGIGLQTGPMFLGYVLGSALFGVLAVQCYIYYLSFPKDPLWMKLYVLLILIIEGLFTILTILGGYSMFGSGWGDPIQLYYFDKVQLPTPAFCGLVTSLVQGFYCWRIIKLTTHKVKYPITGVIILVSLVQLICSIVFAHETSARGGPSVDSVRGPFESVATWLFSAAFADFLIATTMVTILVKARRKTKFGRTTEKVDGLIRLVVETGTITSISATVECILFLLCRSNNLHFIFFFTLAKLYSNTLLAALNARANIVSRDFQGSSVMTGTHSGTFWSDYNEARGTTSNQALPPKGSSGNRVPGRTAIQVHIAEETVISGPDVFARTGKTDDPKRGASDVELQPVSSTSSKTQVD